MHPCLLSKLKRVRGPPGFPLRSPSHIDLALGSTWGFAEAEKGRL